MPDSQNTYKPSDLAKLFGIHSNTIRLYERMGYISPAERKDNNYRAYSDMHILQMKVCRCIFGYPWTTTRIRNAANEVMWSSGKMQWDMGKRNARIYLQVVSQEFDLALKTADILQSWADPHTKHIRTNHENLSRKAVAELFGITVEAVRNWERNNLISSDLKGPDDEVLYRGADLDRLKVIYMLRQAGYSIAAIHHSISMYDKGQSDQVVPALHEPEPDDLISVGDRWQYELSKLLAAAQKIPTLFDELAAFNR